MTQYVLNRMNDHYKQTFFATVMERSTLFLLFSHFICFCQLSIYRGVELLPSTSPFLHGRPVCLTAVGKTLLKGIRTIEEESVFVEKEEYFRRVYCTD